jgi:ribose transport system permease protein
MLDLFRKADARPYAALLLMVVVVALLPLYGSRAFSESDIFNTLQAFAGPGLLALALGITVVAGELDLSSLATYALAGMIAIKTGGQSPVLGIIIAIVVALVIGTVQGYVIARTGINSLAFTLGVFVTLSGLNAVMGNDKSVTYNNLDVSLAMGEPIAGVFSPQSLVTVISFAVVAAVFGLTKVGRNVRAIGGDRRASTVAGVPVNRYLTALFATSSVLAALGGALTGYAVGSAPSSVSTGPLVAAITAVLIGGVSLAGGRGGPIGIAAGAIALGLLQTLFIIEAADSFVSQLILGALLVVAVGADAPGLKREARRLTALVGTPSLTRPTMPAPQPT